MANKHLIRILGLGLVIALAVACDDESGSTESSSGAESGDGDGDAAGSGDDDESQPGDGDSGDGNSGDGNSGDGDSGDGDSGDGDSGDGNSGDGESASASVSSEAAGGDSGDDDSEDVPVSGEASGSDSGDDDPDDGEGQSAPMDSGDILAAIACDDESAGAPQEDEDPECIPLTECVQSECLPRLEACLGENFLAGEYGGVCETYYTCVAEQDDPCSFNCEIDNECINCMTTQMNDCYADDCGDEYERCTGAAFPTELLDGATCGELSECCGSIEEPALQTACEMVVDSGLDIGCAGAYASFCE